MRLHPKFKPIDIDSPFDDARRQSQAAHISRRLFGRRGQPWRPDPNSIGLVVGGPRPAGSRDGFEWFCFACARLLHRIEAEDGGPERAALFQSFHDDLSLRTCRSCGALHPGANAPAGWIDRMV